VKKEAKKLLQGQTKMELDHLKAGGVWARITLGGKNYGREGGGKSGRERLR